jgi:hypothetical protein
MTVDPQAILNMRKVSISLPRELLLSVRIRAMCMRKYDCRPTKHVGNAWMGRIERLFQVFMKIHSSKHIANDIAIK